MFRFRKTKYGDDLLSADFYLDAMNWFRVKYPGARFLVSSDDMPWCEENLVGEEVFMVKIQADSLI